MARILIIEDDPQSARLATRVLEREGHTVVHTSEGLAGLKIAEIPITLHPDGRDRRPHLRSFRDGWRFLRFCLKGPDDGFDLSNPFRPIVRHVRQDVSAVVSSISKFRHELLCREPIA